jgi:hypothetical protein
MSCSGGGSPPPNSDTSENVTCRWRRRVVITTTDHGADCRSRENRRSVVSPWRQPFRSAHLAGDCAPPCSLVTAGSSLRRHPGLGDESSPDPS